MEKTKLIEMLNEALKMEYGDVFLYPREAEKIKEKEISQKFEKFGRMELRHADNLAIQIQTLGGKANWDFAPLETKKSTDEILHDHLELEKKAIELYRNIIELADKEGEDQLKLLIKGIKSEEGSHFTEIKKSLEARNKK